MHRTILPDAALEERPLADDRARPDLGDLVAVDVDDENAVEDEIQLVPGPPCSTSVSSGSSARRSGIDLPASSSREISRSSALSAAVTNASDSSSPASTLAVRASVPGLEVDHPRLRDEVAPRRRPSASETCSLRRARALDEPSARIVSASVVQAVAD